MVQKEWAMVERIHVGDDKDFSLEHKHHKIQQTPSHISKVVATNNFKKPTPWSCQIQNGL
jgi:hypothetical protein